MKKIILFSLTTLLLNCCSSEKIISIKNPINNWDINYIKSKSELDNKITFINKYDCQNESHSYNLSKNEPLIADKNELIIVEDNFKLNTKSLEDVSNKSYLENSAKGFLKHDNEPNYKNTIGARLSQNNDGHIIKKENTGTIINDKNINITNDKKDEKKRKLSKKAKIIIIISSIILAALTIIIIVVSSMSFGLSVGGFG
jgi:hypothetical protein